MAGWWRRRRLAKVDRAAIEASVDDPTFDPHEVVAAAEGILAPLLGRRRGDEVSPIQRVFEFDEPTMPGWSEEAPPEKVHVLVDRPRVRIAMLDRDRDGRVSRATVLAQARACLWLGPFGYRITRVFGASLTGGTGLAYPRRLSAYWGFAREPRGWRFEEAQDGWWIEHRQRTDPAGERTRLRRLQEETAMALAELPEERDVPFEIATNLPDDPEAALRELALVDERFDRGVLEAAIKSLHDRLDPLEGDRIKSFEVTRVRALRMPPEIDVELRVLAPGGWGARREKLVWWRMAATDVPGEPWRVVDPDVDPFGD